MNLINGDCLEELPKIKDKSIDFVFLDLPYGQTACKWDNKIDLGKLWKQLKRVAKNDRTPFFFTTTTKFGYELIKSNEKWFRWDLVWEKNRAAGFLNAYKLPMRKHEMVYCFAKKSPVYDVSSHKDKVVKTGQRNFTHKAGELYGFDASMKTDWVCHKERLPTSIIPPQNDHELIYCFAKKTPEYNVSSHLTGEVVDIKNASNSLLDMRGDFASFHKDTCKSKVRKEPLPTSILPPQEDHELIYCFAKKTPEYDVSSHKEYDEAKERPIPAYGYNKGRENVVKAKTHKKPLPTSIIPEQPSSWCKFSLDVKTGHRTAKPVKLMEYLLKYWSKEGDTILDPTAGSGSMGIACKNMNRKFIGIEMNEDIFELMTKRLS